MDGYCCVRNVQKFVVIDKRLYFQKKGVFLPRGDSLKYTLDIVNVFFKNDFLSIMKTWWHKPLNVGVLQTMQNYFTTFNLKKCLFNGYAHICFQWNEECIDTKDVWRIRKLKIGMCINSSTLKSQYLDEQPFARIAAASPFW